jgi:hypothetical protein
LIEIRGEIEEIRKFNGKLRVNLYKSKTKNQNEKALKFKAGIEIQG